MRDHGPSREGQELHTDIGKTSWLLSGVARGCRGKRTRGTSNELAKAEVEDYSGSTVLGVRLQEEDGDDDEY